MLCPSCLQACRDTAVLCVRCGSSLGAIDPGTTDVPSTGSAWDLTSQSTLDPAEAASEPADVAPEPASALTCSAVDASSTPEPSTPIEILSAVETDTPSAPPSQVAPMPAESPSPAAGLVFGRSMNAVWVAGLAVLALGAIWWVLSARQAADRIAEAPNDMSTVDEAAPPSEADDTGDTAASDATLGPMTGDETALDAPLPPIEEGMLYPEARRALLEAGWVPVEQRADCGIGCTALRRAGFPETEDCADTGAAPCRFIFAGPSGKPLAVGTIGEDLALSAWSEGGGGSSDL